MQVGTYICLIVVFMGHLNKNRFEIKKKQDVLEKTLLNKHSANTSYSLFARRLLCSYWLSGSPDLNTPDYSFWGQSKSLVYVVKVDTREALHRPHNKLNSYYKRQFSLEQRLQVIAFDVSAFTSKTSVFLWRSLILSCMYIFNTFMTV